MRIQSLEELVLGLLQRHGASPPKPKMLLLTDARLAAWLAGWLETNFSHQSVYIYTHDTCHDSNRYTILAPEPAQNWWVTLLAARYQSRLKSLHDIVWAMS